MPKSCFYGKDEGHRELATQPCTCHGSYKGAYTRPKERGACSDNAGGRLPPIIAPSSLTTEHSLHGYGHAIKSMARQTRHPIAHTHARDTSGLACTDHPRVSRTGMPFGSDVRLWATRQRHCQTAPVGIVDTAEQLEEVFFMVTDQTADAPKKFDLEGHNVLRLSEAIPGITPEQVEVVIYVLPRTIGNPAVGLCVTLDTARSRAIGTPLRNAFSSSITSSRTRLNPIGSSPADKCRSAKLWRGRCATRARSQAPPSAPLAGCADVGVVIDIFGESTVVMTATTGMAAMAAMSTVGFGSATNRPARNERETAKDGTTSTAASKALRTPTVR